MSVDDRLREAFAQTDRTWDEQVPSALTAVTARHRHERVVRRGVAAATIAAAAATAAFVAVSQQGDTEPVPAPTPTPSPTAGAGDQANPLDGTWVSEELTTADVRQAARAAGDVADAQTMLAELPPFPFRVVIYVNGDRSSLHTVYRAEGRTEETVDEENVTVTEDTLVMRPMFDDGENVHSWVLGENGTLRFAFVSTTEPELAGIPGEAWQRLIYDTAAFTSGT